MGRKMKESFYNWCITNSCLELLNRWDYTTNKLSPHEIPKYSAKRIYFKCLVDSKHELVSRRIDSLTKSNGTGVVCVECNSFYRWCNKYNKLDYIDRWNYKLNKISPNKIGAKSTQYAYFNCDKNTEHAPLRRRITHITHHNENSTLRCIECNSFEEWCIDNNRKDLLERWDYSLNKASPKEIFTSTNKRYYFVCDKGLHPSIPIRIINITNGATNRVLCPQCNSFETWCVNNHREDVLRLWDNEKNAFTPNDVSYCSKKFIYLKCCDLHKSKRFSIQSIVRNPKMKIICDECNSFAVWGLSNISDNFLVDYWDYNRNNSINPYTLAKMSNKKVWIKCDKNIHESHLTSPADFVTGGKCPYCCGMRCSHIDSLGYNYKSTCDIWSEKNDKSVYEYRPMSNKYVYWKCENGKHDDYKRQVSASLACEFRCPKCSSERTSSVLQEKVSNYIKTKYNYYLTHEYDCSLIPKNPKTGFQMPFDNDALIQLDHLIIEVHGSQHYEISRFATLEAKYSVLTEEEIFHRQKLYDRYKKYIAYLNGYYYLEIPYWTEKDESYKTLIDNKISEILENNKLAS